MRRNPSSGPPKLHPCAVFSSFAYPAPLNITESKWLTAVGIANGYIVSPIAQAFFSIGGWDAGYQGIGGGWRRLAWLGDYVPMGGSGWIWHNHHGFFFVPANATPQSIWLYTDMERGRHNRCLSCGEKVVAGRSVCR